MEWNGIDPIMWLKISRMQRQMQKYQIQLNLLKYKLIYTVSSRHWTLNTLYRVDGSGCRNRTNNNYEENHLILFFSFLVLINDFHLHIKHIHFAHRNVNRVQLYYICYYFNVVGCCGCGCGFVKVTKKKPSYAEAHSIYSFSSISRVYQFIHWL